MKNFTKEERRKIIKLSLEISGKVLLLFLGLWAIMILILLLISIPVPALIPRLKELILSPMITLLLIFILAFFCTISVVKDDIIQKKKIADEIKRVDTTFQGCCYKRVVPLQYDAYQEFFDNLNTLYSVEYHAWMKGEKIIVFFTTGENREMGIKFDEIKKEDFFKKYKMIDN